MRPEISKILKLSQELFKELKPLRGLSSKISDEELLESLSELRRARDIMRGFDLNYNLRSFHRDLYNRQKKIGAAETLARNYRKKKEQQKEAHYRKAILSSLRNQKTMFTVGDIVNGTIDPNTNIHAISNGALVRCLDIKMPSKNNQAAEITGLYYSTPKTPKTISESCKIYITQSPDHSCKVSIT